MPSTLIPSTVLGTAEARAALPAILERFREQGVDAAPVFIGSYRRADAVVISAALAERLAPLLEDLLLADVIRERLAALGAPISGDSVIDHLGLSRDELGVAKRLLLESATDR